MAGIRAKKQPHTWGLVRPGDIISFRYKSESGKLRLQTILVLNPRLNVSLKDGTKTRHLTGIKLEESNRIQLRLTSQQILMFEKIGNFERIDEENQLYRLKIDDRFILNEIKGTKPNAYKQISRSLGIKGQYRTYDWKKTRKSAVFLEPVRIFGKIRSDIKRDQRKAQEKKLEKTRKDEEIANEKAEQEAKRKLKDNEDKL